MAYELSCKDSLSETLKFILNESVRGVADRRHPLRQLSLSTFGKDYPEVRTVVFRHFSKSPIEIGFHTDSRSTKYTELSSNPNCSLLGYNHDQKYQIRWKGKVQIHNNNAISNEQWKKIGVSSRRCYMTIQSPGTSLSECGSGLEKEFNHRAPTAEETESAESHFTLVRFQPVFIDWLYLSASGHRRAHFYIDQGAVTQMTWVTP